MDALAIEARFAPDAPWQPLARLAADCPRTPAGVLLRCGPSVSDVEIDQLRLSFALARHARITLRRIAMLGDSPRDSVSDV